ncbi:hypothetical protein AA0119_g13108 [Alternaria tenuissima]|uniref:DUF4470 domain-containing protein n=2 Tax=Alternaria alternata complex TaxID=187734 RepID=A0A4Q4MZB2_ALTAL|nr:hypothetical protein AA0117_g12909 [Alternaria alternata]RYN85798.1 hypothetical protein AA0119_g13108 [Alternaria tenuissima]RYO03528.1 hypothetical protein AA0121_g13081 [Alternaria tenuissima]RYO47976.1 hypothetical protein AA0116_g12922 [Alternaria tenuissima]
MHWSSHKVKCRSPLNKASWLPDWDRDNREPAWASVEASKKFHNPYGSSKYLWGNTPAIDIAQFSGNEGPTYDSNVALLFAASGDLRNVVKTIRDLPESIHHEVEVTVNDWDFDVVARNAIILLLAFASMDDVSSDPGAYAMVSESLIHMWYSALISQDLLSLLQTKVKNLLQDDSTHTVEVMHGGEIKKTWIFRRDKVLSVTLQADQWLRMDAFLEVPAGLTKESAEQLRAAVVMAPERADYRDRWYFKDACPSMRLAKQQFREDGLLLPFGHSRVEFNVPNPTMFQSPDCWPFDDKSDPMAGWNILEIYKTPWVASEDAYGKLFAYLRRAFQGFLHRMATLPISFQLHNVDAKLLPRLLIPKLYGRIEVSNISDSGYVGTRQILSLFAPLLQPQTLNAHATMITCYLNAVMEVVKTTNADAMPDIDFLARYLPEGLDIAKIVRQGAEIYKAWDCRTFSIESDRYFDKYMKLQDFKGAARDAGMRMKTVNTIVDSWPLRLGAGKTDTAAQQEFNLLLSSSSSGVERYVEWSRSS